MSLLFRVIYAAHCRSTHHKLAMNALKLLQHSEAERWRNLLLKHHEAYLLGAKAPDTRFKDFRNHVLHVEQDYWGGAREAALLWYHRAVETLRKKHWVNGIYATGVLSHYYTDPIQPFHTGQSEAENNIHRAAEWSITKAYDELWQAAEEKGLPDLALPEGEDWLEEMVRQGADVSHPHYQTLIDHYDFHQGRKDPPAGLDETSRAILSDLLGHAAVGWSRILDRLFSETGLTPPKVGLSIPTFLATLQIPVQHLTKKLRDASDRAEIQAIYTELQNTGTVEDHLPAENRTVRELFHADFPELAPAKKPVPYETDSENASAASETEDEEEATLRFYLEWDDPVEDAPSVGPKTGRRLRKIKIQTVQDLLDADPDEAAAKLNVRHITPEALRDWQDQARLVCRVPKLRGHDAQILVACGYRDPLDISTAPTAELLDAAVQFSETRDGQRVIRSGRVPDQEEITRWQAWAGQARDLKAA